MKKYFILALAGLAIASGLLDQPANADGTPHAARTTVQAFYTWYIKLNARLTYPLLDTKIFDFVSKETVDRLRSDYEHDRLSGGGDYFLKVQDEDEQDWLAHVVVHPVVMLGDVAVVPVTFGSADKVSVLVVMRRFEGRWKITRVDDTRDYGQ